LFFGDLAVIGFLDDLYIKIVLKRPL